MYSAGTECFSFSVPGILLKTCRLKKVNISRFVETEVGPQIYKREPRTCAVFIIKFNSKVAHGSSHYSNYLSKMTFDLWNIRIMDGWMVSFEWKHKPKIMKTGRTCRNFVISLWEFQLITIFSIVKCFEDIVKIMMWKNYYDWIKNNIAVMLLLLFLVSFPNELQYFVCILQLVVLQWLHPLVTILLNLLVIFLII